MYALFRIAAFVTVLGLSSACAPPGAPYYHTQNGALMGATAGAVIGHQLDHRDGAWVGGAAGALMGAAIGNDMDLQDQRINDREWRDRYDDSTYYAPPPNRYRRPPPDDYAGPYYDPY